MSSPCQCEFIRLGSDQDRVTLLDAEFEGAAGVGDSMGDDDDKLFDRLRRLIWYGRLCCCLICGYMRRLMTLDGCFDVATIHLNDKMTRVNRC